MLRSSGRIFLTTFSGGSKNRPRSEQAVLRTAAKRYMVYFFFSSLVSALRVFSLSTSGRMLSLGIA